MWIVMLVLVLLGAQLNLSALVPLQIGDVPAPWWVGGRLLWPYAVETHGLFPSGDLASSLGPILGILSGIAFLMAAAALLRKVVPAKWFSWLVAAGALVSIVLQIIWFSGWAIFPLLVDAVLLWAVFAKKVSVDSLRK